MSFINYAIQDIQHNSNSISSSNSNSSSNNNSNCTTKRDNRPKSGLSFSVSDLQNIKRFENGEFSEAKCPSCRMFFDKGKKRKLIDACGHERCYSCIFRDDNCPICAYNLQLLDKNKSTNDYDTGIGGSTSTIVSPIGSPQPQFKLRSRLQGVIAKSFQNKESNNSDQLNSNTNSSANSNSNIKSSSGNSNSTTPQSRRKFFNSKAIKNTFGSHSSGIGGHRRAASSGNSNDITKNLGTSGNKTYQDELQGKLTFLSDKLIDQQQQQKQQQQLQQQNEQENQKNLDENMIKLKITTCSNSDQSIGGLTQIKFNENEKLNTNTMTTDINDMQGINSIGFLSQENFNQNDIKRSSTTKGTFHDISSKSRKSIIRRWLKPSSVSSQSIKDIDNHRNKTIPYKMMKLNLKPLFFEVPLQETDPIFIGRQWMLRELSNILISTDTPGILINGNSGTGKTAFILQLVEYSCFGRKKTINLPENDGIYCQININNDRIKTLASYVVAYHFCQVDNNVTCLVPDFIHSLAAQLCQAPQLIAFRDYLENEQHLQNILGIKECFADPERVIRMAILEPLIQLKNSGKITTKHCIILIDGLCEAEYHRPDHGHTISSFLSKITSYFPQWLKVVCTVRTNMKEHIKSLPFTQINLDNLNSNDCIQKDILEYLSFRISHSVDIQKNIGTTKENSVGQMKFCNHFMSLSKGSFLFCKLVMDLIEKGHLVIKSASYKILPISLAQIFLLHFNLRFPTTTSFEKALPILNVCLSSLYPLTLKEIYFSILALNTEINLDWDEFLERFKLLNGFLVHRLDNTYMFFHPALREWLLRRDEAESTKFLCDFRIGHAALAFRLSRMQAPLDPDKTLELCHHILKAHLFRNGQTTLSARDIQSYWVTTSADSTSEALCTLRNIYSPNVKVSRLLLLAGASADYVTDFLGNATILCIAAHEGIVPMVSLLLEFGANVNGTNSQGCTPLIFAALRGHCDIVRLLIAAGSDVSQTDTTQRCALVHAARVGMSSVVKYLLACDWTYKNSSSTSNVSFTNALQQSLIAAASNDYLGIVEDILDTDKINLNDYDTLTGDTALIAASKNGCLETVSVLLSRGANVDAKNKLSQTALILAIKEGHLAVVERLIQYEADIEQCENEASKTSLMIASEEGHLDIIEFLVERGVDLERQDKDGLTALSWACLRGRYNVVKFLIDKGCRQDHVDKIGRTILDLAAYQGSSNLVQYLIENGAKIEHLDINNMRPLDRAIACRNVNVVQIFLKRGAKLGPATWTLAAGKVDILVILINKLLEDGNFLYRKNRFQDAAYRYQYALKKMLFIEFPTEQNFIFIQLKVNLLLNLSRSKRKMNELSEAIDLATQAIELKPDSYEGYYARAKAKLEKNYIYEASADAKSALEKSKAAPDDVKEIIQRFYNDLISRNLRPNNSNEITDL
ncbi:protein TANC2 isoform X2 [Condylostylus longicornis]|uniref:protein TANC2 isoform X2 n=1 Tax=Condylostylus longicornis TaxID=2530218 RepID=UPI00244E3999|nr:protein TANC2 isoform X2 [Condylostylus longicornis]